MGSPAIDSSQLRPNSLFEVPDTYFDAALVHWEDHSRVAGEDAVTSSLLSAPKLMQSVSLTGDSDKEDLHEEETLAAETMTAPEGQVVVMNRWACSTCSSHDFSSLDEQRSHFKSDFHRLNVKRRLVGKEPVSEEEFEVLAQGQHQRDDDISSISGSDEEGNDSDDETSRLNRVSNTWAFPKLTSHSHISFLLQNSGDIVTMWKCVLLGDREDLVRGKVNTNQGNGGQVSCCTEDELLRRLKALFSGRSEENNLWVVLLAGGGHFAGCVFDARKGSILAHKTHHRYVVRAKAGGRQSSKDATGRAPKSAGASLRRYNEAALQKEIRDVLASWKGYLQAASCIFVHAPSSNGQVLFGGESAPLDRNDFRIRNIPLTTRRPTFKEAKRVFHQLTVLTHNKHDSTEVLNASTAATKKHIQGKGINEASQKPLRGENETNLGQASSTRDASPLKETSALSMDVGAGPTAGDTSTTLHDAARLGNVTLVLELLESGTDPCARDERGRTPYTVAVDKETRNAFRRFMAQHMEMWDWHAANVPSALTDEMETAQAAKQAEKEAKRKAKAKEQKKLRKAKEKAQLAQVSGSEELEAASKVVCHGERAVLKNSLKSIENTESTAFKEAVKQAEALEREKRAAAAEKRIFAMSSSSESSSRSNFNSSNTLDNCCSCCGASLAGKTPFYRYSYKYCSTTCVHVHRIVLEGGQAVLKNEGKLY